MKTPILVTAFSAMVLCANAPAFAGDLPYLGEIMTVPYNFCPVGWLPANGALLKIQQNTALFALLGNSFGGDGKTTFALPKYHPTALSHGSLIHCIATQGIFPPRS